MTLTPEQIASQRRPDPCISYDPGSSWASKEGAKKREKDKKEQEERELMVWHAFMDKE